MINLSLIACQENVESNFENFEELKSSGYISNGWIPRIIPNSSYEIKEIHNIDNNHVFGMFQYSSDSFELLIDSLEQTKITELKELLQEIKSPERPDWFMNNIVLNDNDLSFYSFENFILILKQKEKRVYFVQ